MTLITIAQLLLLTFLAFVPVWAGGQAMTCYQQGNLWRSVAAVMISTGMILAGAVLIMIAVRYNWSFVTFLSAMVL